jgi:hypothetical protein
VHSNFKHAHKTTSSASVFKCKIHFVVSIFSVLLQSHNITRTFNYFFHILPSSSTWYGFDYNQESEAFCLHTIVLQVHGFFLVIMRLSSDNAYFFFFWSVTCNFKNLLTFFIILEVYVKNKSGRCTSSFTRSGVKCCKIG